MKISVWKLAPLLLVTGFCGLAYQVVWLRQLRLVFGSSTAATGMVLAVFMGGLGIGSILLGRLADRSRNPLSLFGKLELGIAGSAMVSPLLIPLVNKFYIYLGGVLALGLPLATGIRILLTTIVLGVPTFLMGGTLPAAARAVESAADKGRRDLALLYGVNSLGGVVGVGVVSFIMLESYGNRNSVLAVSCINIATGLAALLLARHFGGLGKGGPVGQIEGPVAGPSAIVPAKYIYAAAFVSGFAFLFMELVWYRMLSPLLGGSVYTFSLILATALAGIGIGGWLYSGRSHEMRPTISALAVACSLEAVFMAVPYWLGDRLAIFTILLKSFDLFGLSGKVGAWLVVASVVVLLPSIMAGIQFPMLIGLLGQGRKDVGRHTGFVYGWNTAGAILGSLAGGFGLIPLLTAPGSWRLVVAVMALLAIVAIVLAARIEGRRWVAAAFAAVVLTALLLTFSVGPTATWRHRNIGAGNEHLAGRDRNDLLEWRKLYPRTVIWERDGVESSIALNAEEGLAFIVNGKSDGHVFDDAGTQIMGPLVGAILHPSPKQAMVIGLGTGCSSGWLAQVDSIERVDVVELEPAVIEVAQRMAPANFDVMSNFKVRTIIGDAREIVQTTDRKYDVIFSEPSNPYRSGIASLYTREFYESIAGCLEEGGVFSQWLQSYSVDQQTVRDICATLASVFGDVEIWQTTTGDMLLVCSMREKKYDAGYLRQRVTMEPFKSALLNAWGVEGLEGFLAGFVGVPEVPRRILEVEAEKGRINSDDRMLVEFGFARTAGLVKLFSFDDMRLMFRRMNLNRPTVEGGDVDWQLVDENYFRMIVWIEKKHVTQDAGFSPAQVQQASSFVAFDGGDFVPVYQAVASGALKPTTPLEKAVAAEALAEQGDASSLQMAREVGAYWPATAYAIMARFHLRRGEMEEAFGFLASALKGFRSQPWQVEAVVSHALNLAIEMSGQGYRAQELFDLLNAPFSVYSLNQYRIYALVSVGKNIDYHHAVQALSEWEPHVPWNEALLRFRAACYQAIGSPLAVRAGRDLELFLKNKAQTFSL